MAESNSSQKVDMVPSTSTSETSFLSVQLNKKRKSLNPTTTQLTKTDGTVLFLKDQCEQIVSASNHNDQLSKRFGFVVDTCLDLQVGEVLPWLYLSSQDAANDLDTVQKHKFTHILSLIPNFLLSPIVKSQVENHLCLPLFDEEASSLDSEIVKDALNFIKGVKLIRPKNNELSYKHKILVHCNAGVSRAPTVVILYLMLEESYSFHDAFNLVKKVRPCVQPNSGFLQQLKAKEVT